MAGRVLGGVDQACRAQVVTGCFDEIFFHGKPVLVGVEPHSMAWVMGEHADDRSGATWTQALQGFDALEQAVVDGGRGLQRGLVDFQKQRQDAGNALPLEVSLDVFHTKQEAQRVLRKLWNHIESRWTRAEEADRQVRRAWRHGGDRRGFGGAAARAWKKVERLMERYDRAERAWKRIEAVLELFRPDGRLNDRAWAAREITAAIKELDGPEWGKVRRTLADRRSLTFLDRLQRQLAAAEPQAELREALLRLWWLKRQAVTADADGQRARRSRLVADAPGKGRWLAALLVQTEYCRKMAANWEGSYRSVAAVLRHTVRASSAVECMNSVLRMHQGRHRTVTQPMLDLKRLYWNCRRFRGGKRRRCSPYELLGLRLPTTDWWHLLHTSLADLTQNLSSSGVTI
jgi:hypothetical protein